MTERPHHAAKPTAGYPSKTAAIVGLFDDGKLPAEIAEIVEQGESQVVSTLKSKRRVVSAAHAGSGGISVGLSPTIVGGLIAPANVRGISVRELVLKLLEIIADDRSLVENILDDAE